MNQEKPPFEAEKEEQDEIMGLANHPGFKALSKLIDERINYLKQLIDPLSGQEMIGEGDTVEAIGFKFLVVSTVVRYLEEIKNLPKILDEGRKQK